MKKVLMAILQVSCQNAFINIFKFYVCKYYTLVSCSGVVTNLLKISIFRSIIEIGGQRFMSGEVTNFMWILKLLTSINALLHIRDTRTWMFDIKISNFALI